MPMSKRLHESIKSVEKTCWYDKNNNVASRQEAKLQHSRIFIAREFQAILTVWGILDDFLQCQRDL